MKISETWLRRWVDPDVSTDALVERLTLAGLEVDGTERFGAGLEGVMVGEVLDVAAHPDADRLSVCRVSTGEEEVQIVCGAPNVRAGLRSALALPGTVLPNGMKLKRAKLRGVESAGMLCSIAELGLGEESDGIMELPADAAAGTPLGELLGLPDTVIDIDLTPNRGDCFSVLGVAREVATFTGAALTDPSVPPVDAGSQATHPIRVFAPERCPRFIGRVVRGIDAGARTPQWMQERLRRSGVRAIHPVVDVTNYVLLEYGQPLHGYDLGRLQGLAEVRWAQDAKAGAVDLSDVDVLIQTMPDVGSGTLAGAPHLSAVIEVSGSFPATIDYAACAARGVEVLSCAPGFRHAVAEMALGLLIAGALMGYGVWMWIGVIPLATGLMSTCPAYSLFGFSTCPLEK